MATRTTLARRGFLRLSALMGGAITLTACTQTPTPAPSATDLSAGTKAPEPTKVASPAAPAPSATSLPAGTKAAEPTKPAATAAVAPTTAPAAATTAPTAAPAAAKAEENKLGRHLIGKLEGPELVTDPAKYPQALKEAPALADLVKAGKLPAVKERVGEEPLVVKPMRETGKFGGTWRRGFTGPGDRFNGIRTAGHDNVLYWDYTGAKVVPNLAKGWEVTDGGKTTLLFLRKGMKWSDGQPFTADDFVFWYEDLYQNQDLVPLATPAFAVNGKQGVLQKVDPYTVRVTFPDPYYLFPDVLTGQNTLGGQATNGQNAMGMYAPKHYLQQYHPKYAAKDDLDKKVKDAKYDNWVKLFKYKNDWALNPELPVLTAWKTTSPINTPSWILERNPYSIWVDTEGNQLPYVDKITMTLAENLEVINLRTIAGEYDFQERHVDLQKLPVFLENQQKGSYKIYLDPNEHGSDGLLSCNLSYEGDGEVGRWLGTTDFRRALSLGIERDQLNETFWLGLGTPGSAAPAENNPASPGPQYRTLWSTYDPKKANELLDKIGLDKKDGDGYRLRTDGKGRLRIELMTQNGLFMQYTQFAEMIKEQWKKIGIQADVVEVERTLREKRVPANEHQIDVRSNDDTEKILINGAYKAFPTEGISPVGPLYGKWYASAGKTGKEPAGRLRDAMDQFTRACAGRDEKERNDLTKELWKTILDEVWTIGTVGLSPAINGLRVVKTGMGNIPSRLFNSGGCKTPGPGQPAQYYFQK